MTKDPIFPDVTKPTGDEPNRRRRLILYASIANLIVVGVLAWLWHSFALTAQDIVSLGTIILLVVNGALWFGARMESGWQGASRRSKSLPFFVVGALAAAYAIADIGSEGSGGMSLILSVAMVMLGVLLWRKQRQE